MYVADSMCVCVCVRERENVCVYVYMWLRERGRKRLIGGTTLKVLILSSTQKKTVKENKDMLIGGLCLNC